MSFLYNISSKVFHNYKLYNYNKKVKTTAFATLVGMKCGYDYYRYTRNNEPIPSGYTITLGDIIIETNHTFNQVFVHCFSSFVNVSILGGTGVLFHILLRSIIEDS